MNAYVFCRGALVQERARAQDVAELVLDKCSCAD